MEDGQHLEQDDEHSFPSEDTIGWIVSIAGREETIERTFLHEFLRVFENLNQLEVLQLECNSLSGDCMRAFGEVLRKGQGTQVWWT